MDSDDLKNTDQSPAIPGSDTFSIHLSFLTARFSPFFRNMILHNQIFLMQFIQDSIAFSRPYHKVFLNASKKFELTKAAKNL